VDASQRRDERGVSADRPVGATSRGKRHQQAASEADHEEQRGNPPAAPDLPAPLRGNTGLPTAVRATFAVASGRARFTGWTRLPAAAELGHEFGEPPFG
jgi:hypothetical protein